MKIVKGCRPSLHMMGLTVRLNIISRNLKNYEEDRGLFLFTMDTSFEARVHNKNVVNASNYLIQYLKKPLKILFAFF